MYELKPKEQHERILADADKQQIELHIENEDEQGVARVAVALARQCDLYVHFERLWTMRVSDLDGTFSSERYMRNIYVNKRKLHKKLLDSKPQ